MEKQLRDDVYRLVASIPRGKVMTYSQIALLCGHPTAARVVGQIAHFGPLSLPWHRVVNARGKTASGFVPGGRRGQAKLLQDESVDIADNRLDLSRYLWRPR